MSASRLAIAAGLLTLALIPGPTLAARKDRSLEPAPALQQLSIAQIGSDFFIGQSRTDLSQTKAPPKDSIALGNSVRIDQRLLGRITLQASGEY